MKKIMMNAWKIAKNAAKKFGGEAFEYLSGALKEAWSNFKSAKNSLKGKEIAVAAWLAYRKDMVTYAWGEWFEENGKKYYSDEFVVSAETPKAVLVSYEDIPMWIPKSQMKVIDYLYNYDDDAKFDMVLR